MTAAAIAEALERIRALEARTDYMGPHITREIGDARHALGLADGIEYVCDEWDHRANVSIPDEWIDDIIVGAVVGAVETISGDGLDDRDVWGWEAKCDGPHWFGITIWSHQRNPRKIGKLGDSLAIAALLAWEAAMGGGETD